MNQEQNPSDMAKLVLPNGDIDLPIVHATEGYDGVQLGALLKETGTITLDNGYVNTGSCESCITYIDGDKGILRYRGYPIEELAEKATFMEVAYLLIHGHLPNFTELEDFRMSIKYNTELDWDFRKFYEAIPRWGHPMPSMQPPSISYPATTRIVSIRIIQEKSRKLHVCFSVRCPC